jgi:hypothetical protein
MVGVHRSSEHVVVVKAGTEDATNWTTGGEMACFRASSLAKCCSSSVAGSESGVLDRNTRTGSSAASATAQQTAVPQDFTGCHIACERDDGNDCGATGV